MAKHWSLGKLIIIEFHYTMLWGWPFLICHMTLWAALVMPQSRYRISFELTSRLVPLNQEMSGIPLQSPHTPRHWKLSLNLTVWICKAFNLYKINDKVLSRILKYWLYRDWNQNKDRNSFLPCVHTFKENNKICTFSPISFKNKTGLRLPCNDNSDIWWHFCAGTARMHKD